MLLMIRDEGRSLWSEGGLHVGLVETGGKE